MKVGVVGANGYAGAELIRFLLKHPHISLELLISNSTNGKTITGQYPHLTNLIEMTFEDLDVNKITSLVDLLFFATPSGVTKNIIPKFLENDIICVDLSGDFRLKDGGLYEKWYRASSAEEKYLQKAVYGLSELNSESIKNALLIANPGCYPTATILGITPALRAGVIDPNSIIIDGKSGVSGAGRTPNTGSTFSEVNENIKAYKLGVHQHIPEIEQVLSGICQKEIHTTFTTHLVPMTRGIMCTIYAQLTQNMSNNEVADIYREAYKGDSFIRIRADGEYPSTKEVYGSNYCDIGVFVDNRTNRLTIISVIDNLVKGASGQAIQNMNLINGWDERTGLELVPIYP